MNTVLSPLEVRPAPPIELPQVEVVLPMSRAWFDEINAHGINAAGAIACTVSEGAEYISGPGPREDFSDVWARTLKAFFPKIPRRGESVRALIPMRQAVFECLQNAAHSVGISETELALAIIARRLSLVEQEREIRRGVYQAPPVAIPKATPPPPEENTLIFHKCRHCPHRWKPWVSPRSAS